MIDSITEKVTNTLEQISLVLLAGAVLMLLHALSKFLLGKRGQITMIFQATGEITLVYILYFLAYWWGMEEPFFHTPLPFLCHDGPIPALMRYDGQPLRELAEPMAQLLLLSLVASGLHCLLPREKTGVLWFLLRIIAVLLILELYTLLDMWLATVLPQGIAPYALWILGCALGVLMLLGSLRLLVGLVIGNFNPIIGAIFTFFLSNFLGKVLSRAILTTVLLLGLWMLTGWLVS